MSSDRLKRKKLVFMHLARDMATLGTCDRAQVGAVLVKNMRVIATSYNGSIAGQKHCEDLGHLMQDDHCIRTIHAEMNAVIDCARRGVSTEGAELYTTHFPCQLCTKLLLQAGITMVYYHNNYRNEDNPWHFIIDKEQLTEDE